MYPPKYHQDLKPEHCATVASAYPLASLITVHQNTPSITHTPLILKDDRLIGHIDANNPQCEHLTEGKMVTAIFQGPQTYISPAVYSTKQLPTYNYIIAHAKGKVHHIQDPEYIKSFMVEMTSDLEGNQPKFTLNYNDARMDRLLKHIHCFEIDDIKWEGKFKLSQDKNQVDIENAKQELIKVNQKSISDFIDKLYDLHFGVSS